MIQNVGTKNCTFNITTSGAFSVTPTDGFIEKGCFSVCEITFEPVQAKHHEEELKIFYTQCNQCIISRVIGVGCEVGKLPFSSTSVVFYLNSDDLIYWS